MRASKSRTTRSRADVLLCGEPPLERYYSLCSCTQLDDLTLSVFLDAHTARRIPFRALRKLLTRLVCLRQASKATGSRES